MGMQFLAAPPADWKWVGSVFQRDSMYRRNMAVVLRALWFFITALLLLLFRFIKEHVLRIKGDDGSQKRGSNSPSSPMEPKNSQPEFEDVFFEALHEEEEEEKEKFRFEFRFSFQNPESVGIDGEENGLEVNSRDLNGTRTGGLEEAAPPVNVNNYRFLGERDVRGFIHQPKAMTLCVEESLVGDGDPDESWALSSTEKIDRELRERFARVKSLEQSDYDEEERPGVSERQGSESSCEWEETANVDLSMEDADDAVEGGVLAGDVCSRPERGFDWLSSSESLSRSDGYSVKDLFDGYDSDDLLSEREPDDQKCREYHLESSRDLSRAVVMNSSSGINDSMDDVYRSREVVQVIEEVEGESWGSEEGDVSMSNEGLVDLGGDKCPFFMDQNEILGHSDRPCYLEDDSDVEDFDGDEVALGDFGDMNSVIVRKGFGEVGEENLNLHELERVLNDVSSKYEKYREDLREINLKRFGDSDEEVEEEFKLMARDLELDGDEKQEDFSVFDAKKLYDSDVEEGEEDELESLWEHQDLIEQLKLEIKNAKETRLPTIQEESEIRTEDLKPWKIDAKFLQEDPMDELNKFYKSYRERMRKLDILNYQKTYAIEFLQLKDPLQSIGAGKLTFTSLFSENLWPCRRKKYKNNPTERFLRELQADLETVYVGQLCLSWEFLWWQYEKFQELPGSDSRGGRRYNQVAGEFQQFQVLIQRFLEDEPFQGARVPYYVKTRCSPRTILQVPFITEDSKKASKMEDEKKGSRVITGQELSCTMEKSIRILWHFIKSDKDETPLIIKGLIGNRTELQDPTDYKLMAEIQANLYKKEKKLKDLLRVGNCLVRKFKKPQEQRLSKDLFCSQVEMKLVSRVLEMPRITTEQLVWCHGKLDNITFSERRLRREPLFLLFPC